MSGAYPQIAAAVEIGTVQVAGHGNGWLLTGAVDDMLLHQELEQLGAVWNEQRAGYFVAESSIEVAAEFERLKRRSSIAAAAAAARGIRAKKDGAAAFDRYRAAQQRKVTKEIKEVYDLALREHRKMLDDTIADLAKATDPTEAFELAFRRDELDAVIKELAAGMTKAGEAAQRLTSSTLVESAAIGQNVAAWQIDNMAGMHVSRFLAHDTASLAIHTKYDKIAWHGVSDRKAAEKAVRQAISRGLLTGEHPSVIADRITGLFDGSTPGSAYTRAARIAQTETGRIMTEATQETIRAANGSGIKVRNRWDATLDGSTRKSHRGVDGEIRAVGEKFSNGMTRPGKGSAAEVINCRCCLTPVLDGFEPDADLRRNNITGKSIPYQTYKQWEESGGLA